MEAILLCLEAYYPFDNSIFFFLSLQTNPSFELDPCVIMTPFDSGISFFLSLQTNPSFELQPCVIMTGNIFLFSGSNIIIWLEAILSRWKQDSDHSQTCGIFPF